MLRSHPLAVLLSLFMTFAAHTAAAGQYCGGTLEYAVRDQDDRLIDALDVEVLRNGPPLVQTYIRRPIGAELTDHQKKLFKRNNHAVPMLGSRPSADPSNEGNAHRKPNNIEALPVSTFAIRMGCGLGLVELSLRHKGDVMNLRFVNVRELDAVLDSLPFQSGTFEVDLEAVYQDYPQDKSKLNLTGLRSGDQLLLPWHAKGHDLIASSNWKKIVESAK